jgi:hypothetical protein
MWFVAVLLTTMNPLLGEAPRMIHPAGALNVGAAIRLRLLPRGSLLVRLLHGGLKLRLDIVKELFDTASTEIAFWTSGLPAKLPKELQGQFDVIGFRHFGL